MKTISQDTPFSSDIVKVSGGVKYALVNKRERVLPEDDNKVTYIADMIEIKAGDDILNIKKHHALDNIVTSEIGGNIFYADCISRADMVSLLVLKMADSIDNAELIPAKWGCANGIADNVTFGDIKMAIIEGLTKKGNEVGAS